MARQPAQRRVAQPRRAAVQPGQAAAGSAPGIRGRHRFRPAHGHGPLPANRHLRQPIPDLHANSSRFAELWDSGAVGRHEATERKTIDHPPAGTRPLDCDVLTVQGSDLRIMMSTAEPGTEDADRLALITVLGTQALVG
jgi:MmyB-like transcription regulator ligand binding domain